MINRDIIIALIQKQSVKIFSYNNEICG